jgi:hypothetical protein
MNNELVKLIARYRRSPEFIFVDMTDINQKGMTVGSCFIQQLLEAHWKMLISVAVRGFGQRHRRSEKCSIASRRQQRTLRDYSKAAGMWRRRKCPE